MNTQTDDLERRAFAAYFRSGEGMREQPSQSDSGVENHGGHTYVVLRSVRGVLAVYRLTNEGQLRRMKRPPREIQ